jgi:hypothetical protein
MSTVNNEVYSGRFRFNIWTTNVMGQRITNTYVIKSLLSDDGEISSGLGVLQLNYSKAYEKWADEKDIVINHGHKKVISSYAAARRVRIVLLSFKSTVIPVNVGEYIDIKKIINVNIPGEETELFNNQVSLKYTSNNKNMPINSEGVILIRERGKAEIRIYSKNLNSGKYISINIEAEEKYVTNYEELIEALNSSTAIIKLGNDIVLPGILEIERNVIIDGRGYSFNKGINLNHTNIVIGNLNVDGNINIDPGEGGKCKLDKVNASGVIKVLSGGKNSIELNGVQAPEMYISSDTRVVLGKSEEEGNTAESNIKSIVVSSAAPEKKISPILQLHGVFIENLSIEKSSEGTTISQDSAANIDRVVLNGRTDLDLHETQTYIDTVIVEDTAEQSNIIQDTGASIRRIIFRGRANITISDEGTAVEEVEVEGLAAGTNIIVSEGAEIKSATLDVENTITQVIDEGKIHVLNVNDKYANIYVGNEGEIKEINVTADDASISGDGASRVFVQPGIKKPSIEGYEDIGDTAFVSTSTAFYWALDNKDISTIKMNGAKFPLIDHNVSIYREVIIENNISSSPVIKGIINLTWSNITLKNLKIDATECFSGYSAVLVNENLSNINIFNNEIIREFDGIVVLDNSSAVIKGNFIIGKVKENYVTNGIRLGNTLKYNQNINAVLENNTIENNYYSNVFSYASGICIKSAGNIIIDEYVYGVSTEEEAKQLGNVLNTNNYIDDNEIKYFIVNPFNADNEIWAYEKGTLFNEIKNINLSTTAEDMRKAIGDPNLALILTEYNKLSSFEKTELASQLLNNRPEEGYASKEEVQKEVTRLSREYLIPALVKAVPQNNAHNIELNFKIKAVFNMDVHLVNVDFIIIKDSEGEEVQSITVEMHVDDRTLVICHEDFKEGTQYTVTINKGAVKSLRMIENEDISWSFTTSSQYKIILFEGIVNILGGEGKVSRKIEKTGDFKINAKVLGNREDIPIGHELKITVVDITPKNHEQNVEISAEIKVMFDKEVTLINSNSINIKDSNGAVVQGVRGVVDSGDKRIINIYHDDFNINEEYTVTIPRGVVEYLYSILDKSIIWKFTT